MCDPDAWQHGHAARAFLTHAGVASAAPALHHLSAPGLGPSPGQLAVSARSSPCFPMDALAVSTQWLASADLGKNKLGFSFLSKVLFAHSGPQVALTPLHPAVPSGKGFVAGGWSRHPWAPGLKPGMSN